MKKIAIFAAIAALVIAVLACSGSKSSPQVNTPADGANTSVIQQTESPKVGTARSNPAPAGSEVIADNMAFTITSIIRPANSIVQAGNRFNSMPEEGKEYIFVEVNAVCKKSIDEKCSINPMFNIKLIGSKGIEYDPEIMIAGVENLISTTEFYGEAIVRGYIPFIVEIGETDLVLLYDAFLGDTFYLALP